MAEYKQYITQIQENGNVMISEDVIATIVEQALTEVDGVVQGGADVVGKKHFVSYRLYKVCTLCIFIYFHNRGEIFVVV